MKETKFDGYNLKPFIIDAVHRLGFYEPTDIQKRLIPAVLKNESVIGQSQTGTGKTHAYLLPILNRIDPGSDTVQAVITAPTRELANQIYQEALKITQGAEDEQIRTKCFIGGTDKQKSIDKLKTQPHLVVGTPGRIADLIKAQALNVYKAQSLVIDEADLMLDLGFLEDVDYIGSRMPEELQMLVFSATIPEKLKPFLKKYMENPKYAHVEPKRITAEKIEHVLVPSKQRDKDKLLFDMMSNLNPYLGIVFANTKNTADHIAKYLTEKGMRIGLLHGGLTPRERKKVMKQINDLEFTYVIATDLAARGIDIKGVSHVINYELPDDLDFYVHRVGRTARAGSSGQALTIYELSDEDALVRLEKMGIEFAYAELVNGEWKKGDDRHRRKKRKKTENEADQIAKRLVKKPKKVKPGYKKKMSYEMEKIRRKQRRNQSNKGK
ncbi:MULTISPECIES: DEAD/DEAH box helicase [Bacillus]|uniref:DEAD-box ATP-dependent RNA helicase CshB n=1 Tax=Bacillus amyloliquefaciens (strain ATCC 23350 / DSM 7 / BCRC 11601 / CCUG 28519 / NBRC 15535 / NRRL B-14393 / F) TaxID=692420 RepID=A0A9P1NI54_BACAS|nr:DEAD/DEAH box helicase [Bacillus amyloliquefaciens]AIW34457.1 DEAD/DEAH box helicase [Bacillus subtilis]AEB24741.1 DEAD-box RNA helicase [Bacillus amyloliquefaciens TA208]ARW39680.1 RNA helicase [Bacillus amyloliquefaciens]AZV89886.1 DEAD/DEAH box helicase [Bacillus amyloliquefaciens]MBW8279413.1 DEAD/DEAH box helicase [Bacillus amyloliquefaciens]